LAFEFIDVLVHLKSEESLGNEFDHEANNNAASANPYAKQVLVKGERGAFDSSSSNLD